MAISAEALPDDIEALKRLILAREADLAEARYPVGDRQEPVAVAR